jgi:4-amino-4-deoxy-L-arabinose transferase-like glycosyltransferase
VRDQDRRFALGLALITAIGVVWRVVFVLATKGGDAPTSDGAFYHGQALAIADGAGYVDPFLYRFGDVEVAAAHHPPLYPGMLGVASFLGLDSPAAHRVLTALVGGVTIVLVALVARRLAGDRAGLVAAGIAAAVYPNLWVNDSLILSESLYSAFIALTLLTAYRFWDHRDGRRAVELGAAIALAALTRAEASNLLILLAVPLALLLPQVAWRRRLQLLAATGGAAVLVMAPWLVHNLLRFEEPVLLSFGAGGVLPQANCDVTYDGPLLGYWDGKRCPFPDEEMVPEFFAPNPDPEVAAQQAIESLGDQDESEIAREGLDRGLDYINEHRGRAVVVAGARVGRIWGVFRPAQSINLDEQVEGRSRTASTVGLVVYYELVALSVAALVLLKRRGQPILPFISLALMVTVTAAVAIGITRYRMPAEVGLVILSGVAIDAAIRWVRREPQPPPAGR